MILYAQTPSNQGFLIPRANVNSLKKQGTNQGKSLSQSLLK